MLPYRTDAGQAPSHFFAALPKPAESVQSLLAEFAPDGLPGRDRFVQREFARLGLPRWRQGGCIELLPSLYRLGFSLGEPFHEMLEGLYPTVVAALQQNVVVSIDERGTKAAAVTFAGLAPGCAAPSRYSLVFERPFFWAVFDEVQLPLFIGTFAG